MRLERWKLFVEHDGDTRLFDVVGDPEERTELTAARPLERRWLIDVYSISRVYERYWRKSTWGTGANMTADAARELEALR
jgi:hypothetical protein